MSLHICLGCDKTFWDHTEFIEHCSKCYLYSLVSERTRARFPL